MSSREDERFHKMNDMADRENCYFDSEDGKVPFEIAAQKIVTKHHPKIVLNIGYAVDRLVPAFRDLGVEAYGIISSEYLLSQVREDVRPYCFVRSLANSLPAALPPYFDLIICLETAEELLCEYDERFVESICNITECILFDAAHARNSNEKGCSVQGKEYFTRLFAQCGFYDDLTRRPLYLQESASLYVKRKDVLDQIMEYDKFVQYSDWKLREECKANNDKQQRIEQLELSLDQTVEELNLVIADLREKYEIAQQAYNTIRTSFFWRSTKVPRMILDFLKENCKGSTLIRLGYRGVKSLKNDGFAVTYQKVKNRLCGKKRKKLDKIELMQQRRHRFPDMLKFSILVPLYNTPEKYLREMIESVLNQTYQNWELCLADGSNANGEQIQKICMEYVTKDSRIRYHKLERNFGISENTNICEKMATGEYLALLDHDDLLTPDALFENAKAINENKADIVYSDEDHLSLLGHYINPFFKPDWSPDLLYSQMYICHLLVMKKTLFDELGGFRTEYNGAQDYDLMLRLSEKTTRIYHIPKILYHWRESEQSTALNPDSKPYAHDAGLKALDEHLKRKYGENAYAEDSGMTFVYNARFKMQNPPKVSIIIPMKDHCELTRACVESILNKTSYENYEILILDNRSIKRKTFEWFREVKCKDSRIKVIRADMEFNWSKINNFGIQNAKGDAFVFLNNDTLVISEDWLERLTENAMREDNGVAGPLLLYEDNTIQHAGIVVGLGGWADHIFKGMKPIHSTSPYVSPMVSRDVLAVTGACMVISRKTIEKIGLFDERFVVCGSDVEMCIRAHEKGLFNRYDAYTRLYHLESKSRNVSEVPKCDFDRSYECYKPYRVSGDPFYNLNLDLNSVMPKER